MFDVVTQEGRWAALPEGQLFSCSTVVQVFGLLLEVLFIYLDLV